jgi:DNA-binding transcriptional LysR family regulator
MGGDAPGNVVEMTKPFSIAGPHMKSLKGIASFVSVASSGSFAAAAKLQGVSAVAVGKNVATLERQLGVRLIHRTTRALSLTAEGAAFLQQCAGPLRELEAAQVNVQQGSRALSGLVRVTCVSPIAVGYVLPLLAPFHARYPKVQVELHLDDALADMIAQGYDVGIRVGELREANLIARPVAPLPFVACASPAYLADRGAPATLEALAAHHCIRLRRSGRHAPFPWLLRGMTPALQSAVKGNLMVNDIAALVAAAELGLGIACLPLALAIRSFRSGRLRPLLTAHIDAQLTLFLHFPNRKNLPARTRAFVDFMLERLRAEADLQMPPRELLAPFA